MRSFRIRAACLLLILSACAPQSPPPPDPVVPPEPVIAAPPPLPEDTPESILALIPEDTPEPIKSLIAHINDDPDLLHSDYTPAVFELIEVGEPALRPVLRLMLSQHRKTRQHAERVIAGVTEAQYGFVRGRGWKNREQEAEWRHFWNDLGNLDDEATLEQRCASVALWNQWLASREGR